MATAYMLYHIIERDGRDDDEKLVGIYTTPEKAKAAIGRLQLQPGFRDHKDKFQIFETVLDRDDWREGFFVFDPNGPDA